MLAINTGSSSLKFGLFSEPSCQRLVSGEIDWASGNREGARFLVRTPNRAVLRPRLPVADSATGEEQAILMIAGETHRVVLSNMARKGRVDRPATAATLKCIWIGTVSLHI